MKRAKAKIREYLRTRNLILLCPPPGRKRSDIYKELEEAKVNELYQERSKGKRSDLAVIDDADFFVTAEHHWTPTRTKSFTECTQGPDIRKDSCGCPICDEGFKPTKKGVGYVVDVEAG